MSEICFPFCALLVTLLSYICYVGAGVIVIFGNFIKHFQLAHNQHFVKVKWPSWCHDAHTGLHVILCVLVIYCTWFTLYTNVVLLFNSCFHCASFVRQGSTTTEGTRQPSSRAGGPHAQEEDLLEESLRHNNERLGEHSLHEPDSFSMLRHLMFNMQGFSLAHTSKRSNSHTTDHIHTKLQDETIHEDDFVSFALMALLWVFVICSHSFFDILFSQSVAPIPKLKLIVHLNYLIVLCHRSILHF